MILEFTFQSEMSEMSSSSRKLLIPFARYKFLTRALSIFFFIEKRLI